MAVLTSSLLNSRIVFVCARCNHTVERVEAIANRWLRATDYRVYCHNAVQEMSLTDDCLDDVFGSPVLMRVFEGEPRVTPITPEGAAALRQAGFDADRLFAPREGKKEQVKAAVEQQTVNIRTRLIRLRRE